MIKLLVVDDSAFMRMAMRKMVAADPDIQVVGEARNGAIAVQMARELRPDVITMDVEMPEMDGLAATKEIMATAPCAIIMISSLTEKGAQTTMNALALGAVDFIPKKSSFVQLDIVKIGADLLEKIRFWAGQRVRLAPGAPRPLAPAAAPVPGQRKPAGKVGLVVVAVSTGGPAVMPKFLGSMGRIGCPLVIAQHMPAIFTRGFADHMRAETGLNVVEGSSGMALEPGMVVVAPGGTDCAVREPFHGRLMLHEKLLESAPIHPCADVLFRSVASLSVNVVAVVMTGMGTDGTLGAVELVKRQVPILVQEPGTCVVDGMPGSILAAGLATEALSPENLGRRLAKWCN